MTYRILDLFCGAGGAAKGYHQAGFEVVGVDIHEQPHYPFAFIQADAISVLRWGLPGYENWWSEFDAIHASPPCQRYSIATNCRPGLAQMYPDLIGPVREALETMDLPYIIENVPGAPLKNPVTLCGSMFDLGAELNGDWYYLRRHRLFETSWPLPAPPCHHPPARAITVTDHGTATPNARVRKSLPVFGHGAPGNSPHLRGKGYAQAARDAMEIDWMNRDELAEAIPPAFTLHIGRHLIKWLNSNRNREEAA